MYQKGFTLTELMATVVIAAVVVTIAVPGFETFFQNNRLATRANAFVSALNLARSEAIKRGVRVTVCKSLNGTQCTNSGGFEKGWIVFVDVNGNLNGGIPTVDNNDVIIRVFEEIPGGISLTGNANVADYVSYTPDGVSKMYSSSPIDGAFQSGTLTLCQKAGSPGRTIALSSGGRVQVKKEDAMTIQDCPPSP
jgi:type IV fimbrial biogenesis protein FimT